MLYSIKRRIINYFYQFESLHPLLTIFSHPNLKAIIKYTEHPSLLSIMLYVNVSAIFFYFLIAKKIDIKRAKQTQHIKNPKSCIHNQKP